MGSGCIEGESTKTVASEPGLKLRRWAQAEDAAEVQRIVEAGALVVEHDVIRAGDAHDLVDSGSTEEGEEGVHVVLVGLGVVGVADVAAHGEAEHLSAEVVLESGAGNLLAIVEVLRADEADDDDMDSILTMLAAAGVNYIMGVPGADDIMLNYQSSSFHDALYLRSVFGLRPAPEFEEWLTRRPPLPEMAALLEA